MEQFDASEGKKEGWTRTFGHFWCFFFIISNLLNIPLSEKRQKQNREQQRNGDHRFKAYASLHCSLHFVHILQPVGGQFCPLYLETFFILSSRAEKFSSIASRFSFIVCWTWWGWQVKYDRKEAKLVQIVNSYEASKYEGLKNHKGWFSVFEMSTEMSELCISLNDFSDLLYTAVWQMPLSTCAMSIKLKSKF